MKRQHVVFDGVNIRKQYVVLADTQEIKEAPGSIELFWDDPDTGRRYTSNLGRCYGADYYMYMTPVDELATGDKLALPEPMR